MHRTGHSIANDLKGGGADLDDFEVKDSRILTPGTGFTIGPGVYFTGQFGVRSEVSVYFAPGGPEVTTPAQVTVVDGAAAINTLSCASQSFCVATDHHGDVLYYRPT